MTVGFAPSEYTVSETSGSLPVQIRLFGSTAVPLTFFLSTSDQTAASGEDYVGITRLPVVFSSLSTQLSVNVTLVSDGTVERAEQFQVSLVAAENVTRAVINQTTATINVQDSDCECFCNQNGADNML